MATQQDEKNWIGAEDQDEYYGHGTQETIVPREAEDNEPEKKDEPVLMERGEHDDYGDFDQEPYDYATESGKEALRSAPEGEFSGLTAALEEKGGAGGDGFLEYCGIINRMAKVLEISKSGISEKNFFLLTEAKSRIFALELGFKNEGLDFQQAMMERIDEKLKESGLDRNEVLSGAYKLIDEQKEQARQEVALRRDQAVKAAPQTDQKERPKDGLWSRIFR